jgi:PAS domain S-box-containing protein
MNRREKSREELEQELGELKQAYSSLHSLLEKGLAESRMAEAELSESERRFMQVVESAGEWIWEVDAKGLYTYSNPMVEKMLGYTADEIVGKKHFYEFFNAENKEETKRSALQIFTLKQALKEFVNQNVHKDGTLVWLSTTGSPILDKEGKLLGYQGVDTDITERRKVEEALKESEYFFKESQKSAFIGSYKTDFIKGKWESSEVLDLIFGIDKDYDRSVPGWIELVHPGDREMMSSYLMDVVLAKRMPFDKEYRIERKNDGQIRWVIGQGQVKFDDAGNALSLIGTIQDITQRKLNEEKINKLNYAVEATGEVVFMTDNEGVFTYVNPAFSSVYGHQADDVVGKVTPRILRSGMMDEAAYKYFWEELIKVQVVKGELINKTKDGGYIHIESSANAIINERGEAIGFIAIQKDISVRKKIEEELVLAKERAEESDRLKSAFLANMSHEIRTPMNGILGFSALLSRQGVDIEDRQNYIRMIEKSSARLYNLINEIIDISKIESGQMEVQSVETNINEQLKLAYDLLKPDAENRGITLSYQNSLSANETVISTDSAKLYSIITNLLKNAIKYTDQGSVEFGYTRKEKFLEFYVRDTGVGIPENRLEAIFDRFVKAETVVLQARQGAGLGLSITKAFVEMLGGSIWVRSEVWKGTSFYFTLPYHEVGDVIPHIENDSSGIGDGPLDKNLKILIAEDDETSEMLLSVLVKEFSKDVLIARTGTEAIEVFRNNPDIDLILMDIQMPGMNGYEATRQIRKLSKLVIIIAQTAYGILGDWEKARESGCDDYISKPITSHILSDLMHKYCPQ